jgi:hypothetical protein
MFKKSQPVSDPVLGSLERHGGRWRGHIDLGTFGPIPFSVGGSRSQPDSSELELARTAPEQFRACEVAIHEELAAHHEANESADIFVSPMAPLYVAVITLDREPTLEFGFEVPWDDDHTLGAHVRNGKLIELNGSVLRP